MVNKFVTYLSLFLLSVSACVSAEPSASDIRKVVTKSLMSWETQDEQDFLSTSHSELVFAYPGKRTDAEGALAVFRMWKEKFTDTKVYIHKILVDGNRFSAEYQFATTNVASGKRTSMGTVAVGLIQDKKIILLKEYTDSQVDDMQRLGKLPLDEGAEPFPWPAVSPVK